MKTDVDKYLNDVIEPKLGKVKNWNTSASIHQQLFEEIIKVLNKYGMLFDSQPKGYTNTEMKSVP